MFQKVVYNSLYNPSFIKNDFIDRTKIDEIVSQKHLLDIQERVAVALIKFSEKIVKVYCMGGFHWYFTNTRSKRIKGGFSSKDFDIFKNGIVKYNVIYDEAFLSSFKYLDEYYYIEHNDEFNKTEIEGLEEITNSKSQNK